MKLRKGFSLVEIVAVFAIIAIIGLAALARFSVMNEAARVANLDTSFDHLVTATRLFQANNGGNLPTTLVELQPFMEMGSPPAASIEALFQRFQGPHTIAVALNTVGGVTTITASINNLQNNYTGRRGEMTTAAPGGVYTLTWTSTQ